MAAEIPLWKAFRVSSAKYISLGSCKYEAGQYRGVVRETQWDGNGERTGSDGWVGSGAEGKTEWLLHQSRAPPTSLLRSSSDMSPSIPFSGCVHCQLTKQLFYFCRINRRQFTRATCHPADAHTDNRSCSQKWKMDNLLRMTRYSLCVYLSEFLEKGLSQLQELQEP